LSPASLAIFAVGMVGFAFTGRLSIAALYAIGAGACIAMLYVTGNNYIIKHVADEIRGRVFTSMEAVIRISLLASMIITAPLSDAIGQILRRFLNEHGIASVFGLPLTGERLTLMISALIVAGAAYYGFKKLYFEGRKEGYIPAGAVSRAAAEATVQGGRSEELVLPVATPLADVTNAKESSVPDRVVDTSVAVAMTAAEPRVPEEDS
jgi:MFS family permease